jgi:hypothetical protein
MEWKNADLANVAELVPQEKGGYLLQRVPEQVRAELNPQAQNRVQQCANSEIRFVCEDLDGQVTLDLESASDGADLEQYTGNYPSMERVRMNKGERRELTFGYSNRLLEVLRNEEGDLPRAGFDPRVIRLRLRGRWLLHDIRGSYRAPIFARETPSRRLLVYGTSISQGQAASGSHLAWAAVCARRLEKDLVNLGCGGSCFCEPAMADYIADEAQWNSAVLEISVNMLRGGFTTDQFRERVEYFLERISQRRRQTVFCTSIFPFFGDLGPEYYWESMVADHPNEFREILQQVIRKLGRINLIYVPPHELLTDFTGLTHDLLHPADEGMVEMGLRFAEKIREWRAM